MGWGREKHESPKEIPLILVSIGVTVPPPGSSNERESERKKRNQGGDVTPEQMSESLEEKR